MVYSLREFAVVLFLFYRFLRVVQHLSACHIYSPTFTHLFLSQDLVPLHLSVCDSYCTCNSDNEVRLR